MNPTLFLRAHSLCRGCLRFDCEIFAAARNRLAISGLSCAIPGCRACCRYQVCLFCLDRLKLECGSLCPGCRTEYGSEKNPFSKPSPKQRDKAAARAASTPPKADADLQHPAQRAEALHSALRTEGHTARRTDHPALQASPSARPRPLTPHIEHTANGLRPASAKPSGSPASARILEAPTNHVPLSAAPISATTPQPQPSDQLPDSVLPAEQWTDTPAPAHNTGSPPQQSSALSLPEVSSSLAPHPEPVPQPAQQQAIGSSGPLHDEQHKAAVRWVFQHLGLERLPPVTPDPKGQLLLQSVRSAMAAGHITASQGAEQLVAFIKQRGAGHTPLAPPEPAAPLPAGQPSPLHHGPPASANGPNSIWAQHSSAAWPSVAAPTPSHSIWADASSPYTSAPLAAGSAPELSGASVSRLQSLWGPGASSRGPSSPSASKAVADGGIHWGFGHASHQRNGYQSSSFLLQPEHGQLQDQGDRGTELSVQHSRLLSPSGSWTTGKTQL